MSKEEEDEKEKRRKKQVKRMGKILAKAWELPDSSAFQEDGDVEAASNLCCLIAVGNKLDRDGYRVGRHGWEEFAGDLGGVYNRHIVRRTKKADLAKQHLETVKELLGAKDASLATICTQHIPQVENKQSQQRQHDVNKGDPSSPSKKRRRASLERNRRQSHPNHEPLSPTARSPADHPVTKKPKHGSGTAQQNDHRDAATDTPASKSSTSKKKKNPNAELAEREDRAMEMLHAFLVDRGVSASKAASMLEGFTARVTRKQRLSAPGGNGGGGGKFDTNYYNANSRRFRSMLEVGRFFGLVNDGGRLAGGGGGGGGGGSRVQRNVSQQTLAEKKRLRRELERLQKAHQRASKALDDFDVGKEEQRQSAERYDDYGEADADQRRVITRANCASALRPDMDGFPDVPSHCVADVLMSWDFLCTFERALSVTPIALDDFAAALAYRPPPRTTGDDVTSPPVYLAEAHLGLLKMLLQDAYSDDWWWSTLETEGDDAAAAAAAAAAGAATDEGAADPDAAPLPNLPAVHVDVRSLVYQQEDPLITHSWLRALESAEAPGAKEDVVRQAVKTALKVCANKWVHAYLRKVLETRARGKQFVQQAVVYLLTLVRKAKPDLYDRSLKQEAIEKAKENVVSEAIALMRQLASTAPTVVAEEVLSDFEFDDDEESDAESDEDEDETKHPEATARETSERASVIPPRPTPSYTDLLLPPSKPHYNAEFLNSFTWPHILGATAHRILHRKKRLLNETDDFMRSSRELPPMLVAERRDRERLTASRVLTECAEEADDGASPTDRAIEHLCSGGDYLELSTQERLCLLRLLIEASYDTSRLYGVIDSNIKQRTNATKALEVEQRRAKKEAKEKASADEAAARQQLALEAKEKFFDEKRDEIRKLNERNKELDEELIESLTEEDILDFDEDFKADYEALPKPESFNKTEVKAMVVRMQEEAAFDTDSLRVLTLDELLERETRELEEKEGELLGIGGAEALMDPSLDRETLRSIERLQRDIAKSKELVTRLPETREKALEQLRDAMADGTIKTLRAAVAAAKKARLSGPDDETGGVWAVDLLRDAALELENAKQNKRVSDAQKDLVAKMNKCFIRSEPIGHDRFGNRFWQFDQDEEGHVWVETECIASSDKGDQQHVSARFVNVVRMKEDIACGAHDMEDDMQHLKEEDRDEFLAFSRQEYHSSGFTPTLVKNLWGCHATEDSLRSVIKALDSRAKGESELKRLLKESVERSAAHDDKNDATKGDRSDVMDDDQPPENVDAADVELTNVRDSGDEGVFKDILHCAKQNGDSSSGSTDNAVRESLDMLTSGIGEKVRVRQVVEVSKEQSFVRYESGTVTGWKYRSDPTDRDKAAEDLSDSKAEAPLIPVWKVATDRGHTVWLTGSELVESLIRYDKFSNGKGYIENDAAFLSYRNALGRFCGRAAEAPLSSSPIVFARLMVKREGELYVKLKIRSYDNTWGGKSGARALWTNSMKDYAYDFATAKQGLVTLENAFFELTGGFSDYEGVPSDATGIPPDEARRLLDDPKTRNDIELETIEKVTGLWNSPTSRGVFLHLVRGSTTTGFLALALDQLCRNTVKYLQTHKLLKVTGDLGSDPPPSQSLSLYEEEIMATTQRRTRGMNSWQRKQINYEEFF